MNLVVVKELLAMNMLDLSSLMDFVEESLYQKLQRLA